MTVKAKRGRRRYIAFDVPPDSTVESLVSRLPKHRFRVIQCAGGMAILRCDGDDVEDCISCMTASVPGSVSRRTSGTLRSLRDRYKVLRENAPPRPPRKGTPPASMRSASSIKP